MGLLSKLMGNSPADSRSSLEALVLRVQLDLRQASGPVSQYIGRPLRDFEQILGFTGCVYHLARIESMSPRERSLALADISYCAKLAAGLLRVAMKHPEALPAIRRQIPGFDPTDSSVAAGNGIDYAVALYIGSLRRDGELNYVKALSVQSKVTICSFMLHKMLGLTAAETLLPLAASSDAGFKEFGQMLDRATGHARNS